MSWESLSTRLSNLPNVLAGPLLRKVTPDSVTVWFALQKKATVTLTVLDKGDNRVIGGSRDSIAVGKNLHIVAVTADRLPSEQQLVENVVYKYEAVFVYPATPTTPASTDHSIAEATANAWLAYHPSYDKPSFCMPPQDINQLRIIHGSCRKPSGDGQDALAMVDSLIAQTAQTPLQRPHQLLLTGDQIYADDVAASLLLLLTDAATVLLGWDEVLPTAPPSPHPFWCRSRSASYSATQGSARRTSTAT